jgi:hypothetical protein
MQRIAVSFAVVSVLLLALPAMAQDPTEVDSKHYKVVFENDQVRVLRITYGPHYMGVMHEHPASLVVWLTDGDGIITSADGKAEEIHAKAGDVTWSAPAKHRGENMSDQPFEVIEIELKNSSAWTRMSGTTVCDPPSQEHALPVEGRPHHSYVVNQVKCTWTKPWIVRGLASTEGVGTGVVEDHGSVSFSSGTFVDTMVNGDRGYYDYSFKTKTKDGKPTISGHKWELLGGTGKLKGAKGKGTCEATPQEDGKVVYECQGKYK